MTRSSSMKGECNCGAVAFEITGDVMGIFQCHCSICRRCTGANGISVVVVENKHFHWCSGEDVISSWAKPGHDWQTWFCSQCGSTLPGVNDESRMYVPAGLISSGGEELRVLHHIWVDSKAVWDEIGDAGKQHRCAFES